MTSPRFTFKRLTEERLQDVRYLFAHGFGRRLTTDYLRRKYATAYLGVEHVTHVAYEGTKPVAFYGAVPMPLVHNGRSFLGVQVCDFITLPQCRRQGVHAHLADLAIETSRNADVDLIFAMHSSESYASSRRLGWTEKEALSGFEFSTSGPRWASVAARNRVLERLQRQRVKRVFRSHRVDRHQYRNSAPSHALAVDYRPDYLDYRSFTDNHVVQIHGVTLWLSIDTHMKVGDVLFERSRDLVEVVSTLKRWSRRLGTRGVVFQARPNEALDEVLQSLDDAKTFVGFQPAFHAYNSEVPASLLELNLADFDTF